MEGLEERELTGAIIGAALEVHRGLGPGFLESVYENALCVELGRRAISFDRQLEVPVLYVGLEVGRHRVDLVVAERVVVELKAIKALEPIHFAVLCSYLRASDKRVGLLLNFHAPTLQVKRVLNPAASALPPFRVSAI